MFIKSVMGLILNLQSYCITNFLVATSNLPSNQKIFVYYMKKYYNIPYNGSENSRKVGTVHNFISRKEEKMASAKLSSPPTWPLLWPQ